MVIFHSAPSLRSYFFVQIFYICVVLFLKTAYCFLPTTQLHLNLIKDDVWIEDESFFYYLKVVHKDRLVSQAMVFLILYELNNRLKSFF